VADPSREKPEGAATAPHEEGEGLPEVMPTPMAVPETTQPGPAGKAEEAPLPKPEEQADAALEGRQPVAEEPVAEEPVAPPPDVDDKPKGRHRRS
jgi:hypothetical protein